jgi:uncharacterized protein (DUF1800 family)
MGGENTVLSDAASVRHVLRRTGFGAFPKDVTRLLGRTRGSIADELLSFKPGSFKPSGSYYEKQVASWVKYMVRTKYALNEKLVLFWHDHFATGFSKVGSTFLMGLQNRTLRLNAKGNMKTLVKLINKDAAMMEYLDTVDNYKAQPNENYGRELMELFTIGVFDLAGNRNYGDQSDVAQMARAFSGWRYSGRNGKAYFDQYQHDYTDEFPERGPKVLFQADVDHPAGYGGFGAGGQSYAPTPASEGPSEIDVATDILFAHRDSEGQSTVARRTAKRLWEYFGHGGFATPDVPLPREGGGTVDLIDVIDEVIASSNFATEGHPNQWSIAALLRAIFVHDEFYRSLDSDPAVSRPRKSVKWPVDFLVGTMRQLGVKPQGAFGYIASHSWLPAYTHLQNMGQVLLDPPSVFGWDWEAAWLSSSALLARFGFARDVSTIRYAGRLRVDKLVDLDLTDPEQIVQQAADALGIAGELTTADRDALVTYLLDDAPTDPLDLKEYYTQQRKLRGLLGLLMTSPAYQVH